MSLAGNKIKPEVALTNAKGHFQIRAHALKHRITDTRLRRYSMQSDNMYSVCGEEKRNLRHSDKPSREIVIQAPHPM